MITPLHTNGSGLEWANGCKKMTSSLPKRAPATMASSRHTSRKASWESVRSCGEALAMPQAHVKVQRLPRRRPGNRRKILFMGDGAFQLTAQEVSTMIRHKLNLIIFVVCNDGYTIERCIHGWDATYNDVQKWNYKDLVPALGAQGGEYKTYQVKTKEEVEALFSDKNFCAAPYLQFVELYMPRNDVPAPLKLTAEAAAKNNSKED